MKRKLFFLIATIMAGAIAFVGSALYNKTYVWDNTFDVTQPNILCSINVGDYRYVNAPVNVDVSLGLQKTIFSDDFESYAAGTFPNPQWTLVFNGNGDEYQVVVNNVSSSPTKSLQLVGNVNWAADAVRFFSSSSPTIGFEVNVRVDNSSGIPQSGGYNDAARVGFWKRIDWGDAAWYESVTFAYNGTIIANGKSAFPGGQALQSYVPGQWYDVKLIVDRPNRVFSVWINGTLEGQNLQGCDDPYTYDGLAVSGRYTQTTDNFDDAKIFEATMPATSLSNFNINGTYSVELQYWNTTTAQWQHVQYLQQATNITLMGGGYAQTYTFTPELEGKYKVEVTLAYDSTVDTFNGQS
jgi:hypothetical protein